MGCRSQPWYHHLSLIHIFSLTDMTNRLKNSIKLDFEVERMEPLFATEEDYEAFNKRQSAYQVKKGDLSQYHGNCYLGIDAGSTTTKTALVGEDGTLLYSFYSNNCLLYTSGSCGQVHGLLRMHLRSQHRRQQK